MTKDDYVANIIESLDGLTRAVHWLQRSLRICSEMTMDDDLEEEDYDALETLTSRYARVSDIIVQKGVGG